jgi:ribonuclease HI
MWALWMMRNKCRHGEQGMTIHQAAVWARDTAFDLWQLAQKNEERKDDQLLLRWKLPDIGWSKVNTDAAFSLENKTGATACVIRDHQGSFRGAQARWYDRPLDACLMEAIACIDGLTLARELGLQRVILETDSLEVHLWKKQDAQRSIVEPILREIEEIRLAFLDFSFCYVNRKCNEIAHVLAKQVTSTHCMETWHVTPACVSDLIMYEASAPTT